MDQNTLNNNANNNSIETAVAFDLIKGQFKAEEAKEILMHMLQTKMEFHELKIFSNDIRFGTSDEASIKRLEELRVSRNELKKFIDAAEAEGRQVRIKTTTQIELI